MKAIEKIKEVSGILSSCGIESAEREAELMIRYGLGIDRVKLYGSNPDLNDEDELQFDLHTLQGMCLMAFVLKMDFLYLHFQL